MELINRLQFQDMEDYTINYLGVKEEMIIENAALKLISHINLDQRQSFAVICGVTQNGSYGLAIARNLIALGKFVDIYIVESSMIPSESFKYQFEILKKMDSNIHYLETIEELENFPKDLNRVNTLIDSIVGIEWDNNFHGTTEYVIDSINKSRIYTISVDLPSGMDYDTGDVNISCVESDLVVTFEKMKKALLANNNLHKIEIKVENIGLLKRGRDVRHKTY